MKSREEMQILWQREEETMTLEGEPVLSYTLSWPQVQGAGLGGRGISRYYARLAKSWRRRWRREVYWKACLELVERRSSSKPFVPWSGGLFGQETWEKGGFLGIKMEGEEVRGDGKTCRVAWGDLWKVGEGAPVPPRELHASGRRWRKETAAQVLAQGRERQGRGELFLDRDWEKQVIRLLPEAGHCLTKEGVEVIYPQGTLAPAAEGTPAFLISLREEFMKLFYGL